MSDFPVDRYLRAARHRADLSQRELAEVAGVPPHVVAKIEHSPRLARVQQFARVLDAIGLSIVVVDREGVELAPQGTQEAEIRDRGMRRFPAHLDVRPGSEAWWGEMWPMFEGRHPAYTFDRARWRRDSRRRRMSAERERAKGEELA